MIKISIYFTNLSKETKDWAFSHLPGLFLFNIILMLQMLLYTAGYFSPFFPITINFIVMTSLILAVFVLGVRSRVVLVVGIFFWIFAGLLQMLRITVWAERTAVYAYEAFLVGVVLLIFESLKEDKRNNV